LNINILQAKAGKTRKGRTMSRTAYAGITLAFFVVSAMLHWGFGWLAFAADAAQHGQEPQLGAYIARTGREIFANWESHSLQLLWQLAGLAWFLRLGSDAASRRGERVERKLDVLLGHLALTRELNDIDEAGGRHG
jgi:hypothetical protein